MMTNIGRFLVLGTSFVFLGALVVRGEEASPATITLVNVSTDEAGAVVKVDAFPEVTVRAGGVVGPVGLAPGNHVVRLIGGEKVLDQENLQLKSGEKVTIVVGSRKLPVAIIEGGEEKKNDQKRVGELRLRVFPSIPRDVAEGVKAKPVLRVMNLSGGNLRVRVGDEELGIAPAKAESFPVKRKQSRVTINGTVEVDVDFRDLTAGSLAVFVDVRGGIASVFVPEAS